MYIIYPSPGSLQFSKERGGERIFTHYVQFLLYCTACTTLGGRKGENGTFSKPVKEIVTFIYNKNISL
jgi:hypothetical protein